MSLWLATADFLDPAGRRGSTDFAVEAETRDMAAAMVRIALVRRGRMPEAIEVGPLAPGAALGQGVGVGTPLAEGPVRWHDPGAAPATTVLEHALDDGPPGAPPWLPPAAWAALYVPEDGARPYALIDPTTWFARGGSLPDELAESGLAATCLFEPGAEDELLDLGPWLVDLTFQGPPGEEPPTPFHKRVFAAESMLFLRSPLGLAEFRRALRKLTRVRDTDDKWYFNRFWEPEFFLYFVLFLEGRRLLAPLADLRGFAFRLGPGFASATTDLSASRDAAPDRQGDMDLLFDAGTAMVALRHARKLEAEFARGLDPHRVYDLARERLSLDGMDYRFVAKCVDIAYSALAFYGAEAAARLGDPLIEPCFGEDGELTMQIDMVHGQAMFGLRQGIAPHLLRSELRF